jgi:sRNA-binding protein
LILDRAAEVLPCLRKPYRPLALGSAPQITDVLMTVIGITQEEAERCISYHVARYGYLKSCKAGVARVLPDGTEQGVVSERDAAFAAQRLAYLKKKETDRRSVAGE